MPNVEGEEVAWAGKQVCVVEEGQCYQMVVKRRFVEVHLAAAAVATVAVSFVPVAAEIVVVKISEIV